MSSESEKFGVVTCSGGKWKTNKNNGILEYMPLQVHKGLLLLPLHVTYSRLLTYVLRKLGLPDSHTDFCLTYKIPSNGDVVELFDNHDVSIFIDMAVQISPDPLRLFVTQTSGNGGNGSGVETERNQQISYLQTDKTQETTVPITNPERVPKNKPILEVGSLVPPPTNKYLGTPNLDEEDSQSGDEDSQSGDENSQSGNEDSQSGDEYLPTSFPHISMPYPVISTSYPVVASKASISYHCSVNASHVKFQQTFKTKKELKRALALKFKEEGFQMKTTQSTPESFEAICLSGKCEWRIKAVLIQSEGLFQVVKFEDRHTCSRTQIRPHHRQVDKMDLVNIVKVVMTESNTLYRVESIVQEIDLKYNIDITYSQAWSYARYWLMVSLEQSFSQLPVYCHNLEKVNPGTVTKIKSDEMGRFELFFVAIGCSISAFVKHLRPLIILDGTCLEGPLLGMMLAFGMDGNNKIFPIAFGLGKIEREDSWTWFLARLKECIGDMKYLAFISNRGPSLDLPIKTVFPTAFHGFCCQHLSMYIQSTLNEPNERLFWKACKAYRVSDFEEEMAQLRQTLPFWASRFLDDIGHQKWSRAHFPGTRFNIMTTSKTTKFMNELSSYAKISSITALIDYFRYMLEKLFCERRMGAVQFKHGLTPWARSKIVKRIGKSATWNTYPVTNNIYYGVWDGHNTCCVDLHEWTCSCRQWQLSGLPCGHLLVVMMRSLNRRNYNIWATKCYTIDVYRATYQGRVNRIPCNWEGPDEYMIVKPPATYK